MTTIEEKTSPDLVGTIFLLWRREWRNIATMSSRVDTSDGWVVLEEVLVTVIEQRNDVPGMFGGGTYMGLKAVAEDGREFTRNWESYPDDVRTGATLRWHHINAPGDDPFMGFVDAIEATSVFHRAIGGQYYDEAGKFKVPTGAEVCKLHGDTHLPGQQCDSCRLDELLIGSKGEVSYIDCPFCYAKRRGGDHDKYLRGLHIRWDHPAEFLRWTAAGRDPNNWTDPT